MPAPAQMQSIFHIIVILSQAKNLVHEDDLRCSPIFAPNLRRRRFAQHDSKLSSGCMRNTTPEVSSYPGKCNCPQDNTDPARMKHRPFRGLGAILFKEFIVVWRDPMTLFFMFFPPLVEMIAFGYALDTDVKHMAMVVLNEDRTVESRQFSIVSLTPRHSASSAKCEASSKWRAKSARARLCRLQIPPKFTEDPGRSSGAGAIAGGWLEFHHRAPALNTALAVA